jgi:protein-S-isoprenylcysteine O-methyltransferase Ste14
MDRSRGILDRAEGLVRWIGGLIAIGAALVAAPGVIGSTRSGGPESGHPGAVFAPARLLSIALGWFAAAAVSWRPLPVQPKPAPRWALLIAGFAAYVGGFGLAVAGRLALGRSYRPSSTIGLALPPEHRLVTDGPYGLVRHPMYLGLMTAALGALALYRTWTTALFVVQLPVLVIRARREEALLEATYGDAWRRYVASVPAWLPSVRRRSGSSRPDGRA